MSTPRRILVVEDDRDLAGAVRDILLDADLEVDLRHDGEAGLAAALEDDYDVIVLDIMLPKKNGFSVCRELREAGVSAPVLILTAKDGELDEAESFDVGADQFLRKPFERLVLLARVQALLRRRDREREPALVVGELSLDLRHHRVSARGEAVELTPREYTLLECLASRYPRAVSKADLLDVVWGSDFDGDPNIVEVYVGYLRRKVDEPGAPSLISTLRGVGYCLRTP